MNTYTQRHHRFLPHLFLNGNSGFHGFHGAVERTKSTVTVPFLYPSVVQGNLFHSQVAGYTSDDASGTTIRFASGGLAVLAATNGAIPNRWDYDWRLMLPGLTADFSDANHAVFHDTRPVDPGVTVPAETVASDGDLYLAETLDLLAAIRDNRPTAVPIEEGVRTLRLALAASQAAERNAPVDLPVPAAPGEV